MCVSAVKMVLSIVVDCKFWSYQWHACILPGYQMSKWHRQTAGCALNKTLESSQFKLYYVKLSKDSWHSCDHCGCFYKYVLAMPSTTILSFVYKGLKSWNFWYFLKVMQIQHKHFSALELRKQSMPFPLDTPQLQWFRSKEEHKLVNKANMILPWELS